MSRAETARLSQQAIVEIRQAMLGDWTAVNDVKTNANDPGSQAKRECIAV